MAEPVADAGKIHVLIVDDETSAADAFLRALNYFGCVAKSCASIAQARKLMSKERFDVVVSDILLPDSTRDEVEHFLRETVKKGIGLMIYSGAVWKEKPKIEGAVIIRKLGSFQEYMDSIRRIARQRQRVKPDDKEFRKLVNPERHIDTPMMKWEKGVLEPGNEMPSDELYLEYLRRELKEASRCGYSNREMNNLMDKYARQATRVRRMFLK